MYIDPMMLKMVRYRSHARIKYGAHFENPSRAVPNPKVVGVPPHWLLNSSKKWHY